MTEIMKTELTFYADGTMHCDGLGINRAVRIGGGAVPGQPSCTECPRFIKCGMSHTSEVATKIKDLNAIKSACKEMGLAEPKTETVQLYDGKTYTGVTVRLPGWRYPVVIDTKSGQLHFDNYNGKWGKQAELNRLSQLYGVAKATIIARSKGYQIQRSVLSNGTIRLSVSGM